MSRSRKIARRAWPSAHLWPRSAGFVLSGAVLVLPQFAWAGTPMAYTAGFGTKSYPVVSLLWGLIAISLLVMSIVGILLCIGIFRRRPPLGTSPGEGAVVNPPRGLGWIYTGSAVSGLALFGVAIWTFAVLANVSAAPEKPGVLIHVTGHQWWWEAQYLSPNVTRDFTTANEIHIPTGEPIRVELSTADVIHSFWVPELTGKTDTIPHQHNVTWFEADKPGIYRGQCTEYCGLQHAHMSFYVIAQPKAQFEAWRSHELQPEPPPGTPLAAQGELLFRQHCGACHTVRGNGAHGTLGPDLTHLMTRRTIAAGTIPNTVGYLSAWISDPQHIKPGNFMPDLNLSAADLTAIRTYLETLR